MHEGKRNPYKVSDLPLISAREIENCVEANGCVGMDRGELLGQRV